MPRMLWAYRAAKEFTRRQASPCSTGELLSPTAESAPGGWITSPGAETEEVPASCLSSTSSFSRPAVAPCADGRHREEALHVARHRAAGAADANEVLDV